ITSKMMDTTLAAIFAGVYDGHAESFTKSLGWMRPANCACPNRSMFVSIIMKSLPWEMPFGRNGLLLHFNLETAPIFEAGRVVCRAKEYAIAAPGATS
ncbi:MAG: hypothetical protein VB142_04575, partial [Burkholderia sp.]